MGRAAKVRQRCMTRLTHATEVRIMARQPFIETLETRRFLDATAVLASHGRFKVSGDDTGEAITVALNAAGDMVQAKIGDSVIGEAAVDDVRSVFVNGGGGDDTLSVDDAVEKRVVLYGGDGNDTLSGGSARVALLGGGGNDTLNL